MYSANFLKYVEDINNLLTNDFMDSHVIDETTSIVLTKNDRHFIINVATLLQYYRAYNSTTESRDDSINRVVNYINDTFKKWYENY